MSLPRTVHRYIARGYEQCILAVVRGAPAGGTGELPEVERSVARQAARWMMLLGSGRASPSDLLACEQWRSSKAEHEHAWQRAQRVSQRFGLVPATLGMAALNRPASPRRRAVLKTLALTSATGPLAWPRGAPIRWIGPPTTAAPPASCAKWRSATDPVFT